MARTQPRLSPCFPSTDGKILLLVFNFFSHSTSCHDLTCLCCQYPLALASIAETGTKQLIQSKVEIKSQLLSSLIAQSWDLEQISISNLNYYLRFEKVEIWNMIFEIWRVLKTLYLPNFKFILFQSSLFFIFDSILMWAGSAVVVNSTRYEVNCNWF